VALKDWANTSVPVTWYGALFFFRGLATPRPHAFFRTCGCSPPLQVGNVVATATSFVFVAFAEDQRDLFLCLPSTLSAG
jgi:hypothetical protein